MIEIILALVAGVAVGAAGYRYMLKNDPATLEKWAAEIKDKSREFDDL